MNYTGVCFGCMTGFTLNKNTNQCINCSVSNCDICSADNFCGECADTFVLNGGTCECPPFSFPQNNGTTCGCPTNQTYDPNPANVSQAGCRQNCGIEGCTICSTDANGVATCSQCIYSHIPLNNGTACSLYCDIFNCTFCSCFNYCSQCDNNLTISTFGDTCLTCNVDNC